MHHPCNDFFLESRHDRAKSDTSATFTKKHCGQYIYSTATLASNTQN